MDIIIKGVPEGADRQKSEKTRISREGKNRGRSGTDAAGKKSAAKRASPVGHGGRTGRFAQETKL